MSGDVIPAQRGASSPGDAQLYDPDWLHGCTGSGEAIKSFVEDRRLIVSFKDKGTEAVFHGTPLRLVRRYPADVVRSAERRFDLLNAARSLEDLRMPPGNRPEELKGELTGWMSI